MENRITRIIERLFVREPALFAAICTQEIVENDRTRCPVRCGRGRIEYNPDYTIEMSDAALEEALKNEAIRILLKHPYERRPDLCSGPAIGLGSNLVIADNYPFARFHMKMPADFGIARGLTYEMYSRHIQRQHEESPLEEADYYADLSELWDEDALQLAIINEMIGSIKEWGSLAGDMAELIQASAKTTIDWRKVLAGFRAQIITMDRRLTRMRPSRRTGFDNMGSQRKFATRLLVAMDVSASITSEAISNFLGVINSAFRYGVREITVIQFDSEVTGCMTIKHALKEAFAVGRGGTNFQAPIDYAAEYGFEGLIILTDGLAPEPVIPENFHGAILWVCESQSCYQEHSGWMRKYGRVCTMSLE